MRVAVVNETSAVAKHPFIMSALEGRGLDVVNAGMAESGEEPELQYIHTGVATLWTTAVGLGPSPRWGASQMCYRF